MLNDSITRAYNLPLYGVSSGLSQGLHDDDDDDDEYHSMFCCMIFGVSSAHGSLSVLPLCSIAVTVNPIKRSGASGLTSTYMLSNQSTPTNTRPTDISPTSMHQHNIEETCVHQCIDYLILPLATGAKNVDWSTSDVLQKIIKD
jgi:hypothetical protein